MFANYVFREAWFEVQESRAIRTGLSDTQVALQKSNQEHQKILLKVDHLQSELHQEKQKTVRVLCTQWCMHLARDWLAN